MLLNKIFSQAEVCLFNFYNYAVKRVVMLNANEIKFIFSLLFSEFCVLSRQSTSK